VCTLHDDEYSVHRTSSATSEICTYTLLNSEYTPRMCSTVILRIERNCCVYTEATHGERRDKDASWKKLGGVKL